MGNANSAFVWLTTLMQNIPICFLLRLLFFACPYCFAVR